MGKRKRRTDDPMVDMWKGKAVMAMSERDAVLDALGVIRQGPMRDVVVGYARLHEATHPMVGASSAPSGNPQPNRVDQPLPGAATSRDRARLRRIDRKLRAIADELNNPDGGRRIEGPRCSACNRSVPFTARFCDSCGTAVGGPK